MMKRSVAHAACLIALLVLAGCRGMQSDDPPIHPNLNMDFQERFDPQEANPFFEDNMAMRPPVPGTVARGLLLEDTEFYLGRTGTGEFVEEMPVPVTREMLLRGRERYDIFCAVCHGKAGDGQGIIMTGNYGYTPATNYHDERLREAPAGYLYDVITNGVRNMPSYAQQVPVADRWAIVTYIRALQRSQYATEDDIPPSVLARIEQGGSANIDAARTGAGGGGTSADTTQDAAGGAGEPEAGADTTGAGADEADANAADTTRAGVGDEETAGEDAADTTSAPAGTTQAAAQADTAQSDAAQADTMQSEGDTARSDSVGAAAQSETTQGGAQPDSAQGAAAQADSAQGTAAQGGTTQGAAESGSAAGAASAASAGQAQDAATAGAGEGTAGAGEGMSVFTMIMLSPLVILLIAAIIIGIAVLRRSKKQKTAARSNP